MVSVNDATSKLAEALDSDDVIIRKFSAAEIPCALVYLDGLSDKLLLEQHVIAPLLSAQLPPISKKNLSNILFYGEQCEDVPEGNPSAKSVAEGEIILLVDGAENPFMISLKQFNHRAVTEPPTETVLKGPREGFTEEIKTNLTLVRRRLKTPALRIKQYVVGRYSNTTVALLYVDGIADNEVVSQVAEKISKIDVDGTIGAGYIERYVEVHKGSIFNQTGVTEKPDIVAAKLLEGRVAIIVDGTPVVVTLPYLLFEGFQDSYDYYIRDSRSTMLRTLRVIGAAIAVLLPGLYVALQEYHYHLLPLKFLISILNSVSGIPFTPPMEMLFVLILFEILYQASIRMPRYVGTAMSIVGAIVLGDTAVNAGLLSSPTVLIIAISAIGINCVPDLVDTFSLLRLAVLLIGSVLGLFGIVLFSTCIVGYLAGLESYKTPYLAPFGPMIPSDLKDALIKDNLVNMKKRPYSIPTENRRRSGGAE